MSKDQPYLPRQGVTERVIVEEMMRNQYPEHWEACDQYVRKFVHAKAKNIPDHLRDDVAQEILYKIVKYLPHFRFQCILKTWVNQVIEYQIIDEYRKLRNERPHRSFSVNHPDEADSESQEPDAHVVNSAEDTFEILEKIRIGIEALRKYAATTANPIRNGHIINMVLFEGKTYQEAALAVGCKHPVVGHVVREAQRYAREMISR